MYLCLKCLKQKQKQIFCRLSFASTFTSPGHRRSGPPKGGALVLEVFLFEKNSRKKKKKKKKTGKPLFYPKLQGK